MRSQATHELQATSGEPTHEASVRVLDLQKTFQRRGGGAVHALDKVTLDIAPGELVVLLGPSGCGKTTLLRCIGGLETPDAGEIHIHGHNMMQSGRPVPPERRNIGMMFQSYALWPHMTVERIVSYPLEARKVSKQQIRPRVAEILESVGISQLAKQYPSQMSGGQQQRVALARSLVARPTVMLFDEPLSNVDAKVRSQLRIEILRLQRMYGFAGVYVTHDQDEAMQMADTLAVMKDGRIVQIDEPRAVYRAPASEYVGSFLGSLNKWDGVLSQGAGSSTGLAVDVPGLEPIQTIAEAKYGLPAGQTVCAAVRPEAIQIQDTRPPESDNRNIWKGTIVREMFVGSHTEYEVVVGDDIHLTCWTAENRSYSHTEAHEVWLTFDPNDVHVFPSAP